MDHGSIQKRSEIKEAVFWLLDEGEDTITNRMLQWKYSNEQKEELKLSLTAKIPKKNILEFYYPETSVERMREIRKSFEN